MDNKLIKEINRYFHDEESRFFDERHVNRIESEALFYEDFLKNSIKVPGRAVKALDIGTGTGLIPGVFSRMGGDYELVTSDISLEMLKKAKNKFIDKSIRFVNCDAENLPFKDKVFSIVTCSAAMHHFPSIEKFAKASYSVLKDDGFLIIGYEPNRSFWRFLPASIYYRMLAKFKKPDPHDSIDYEAVTKNVNDRLIKDKIIGRPLSRNEMLKYVDIHSPNSGDRIDYSKGFDIKSLLNGPFKDFDAEVVHQFDDITIKSKVFKLFFPKLTPQFSLILKKKNIRKKVLFLFVHLNFGGAEVGLLTTLKNIDTKRFDCEVVSIEKKGAIGEEIEKLGFKVTYLDDDARLFNLSLIFKIKDILKKVNPDILHTSLFYANFFGRVAAIFHKPKAVITEERSMYTEKKFYHVLIDRVLAFFTDKIIVCSESVLNFTIKQEKIGPGKFYLIYNAVDAARFDIKKSKIDLRKELGLSQDDLVLGSVGSVIPKKNHRFLIESYAAISDKLKNSTLIFVGEGESKKELMELTYKLGIKDKVRFFGQRNDIPELMKAMDVFILPSLQEGFPRTLIEAMYTGIPSIATNISGIPEILKDGENGFLIEPGDTGLLTKRILELSMDRKLREKIGAEAKKTIESGYLPDGYAKKLEALYGELA